MHLAGIPLRGRLLALVALAATAAACGGPPGETVCELDSDRLATDPVYITLGLQETIRLDEPLAEAVASALDRARAVEPHLYRIHTLPPWWPERLHILAESEAVAAAWRSGQLMTGVAELDFLLAEYFAVEVELAGDRPNEFVLHFGEVLNTPRLLERISAIEGLSGSVVWMFGDSNEIDVLREDDGRRVTFTLGWGDCSSGCIYHHRWEVWVPEGEGEAELVREGGESAEWFMDCVPVPPDVSAG